MRTLSSKTPLSTGRFVIQALPAVVAALLLGVGRAEAQRVVVVYEEPRHRVVRADEEIKLMDIQIQPNDTTLDHTHDSPILYTFISSGTGPSGGRVSSNIRYAEEPFTHRVSNDGDQLFRIIAMAHYGPGQPAVEDGRPRGLTGEPQLENEWFRSYRIELQPGEETPQHLHENDVAIVLVSAGRAEVTKATGFGAELTEMGAWTWRDAASPYTIRNGGSVPISVVVNEARR